jgi:hypothetical protein
MTENRSQLSDVAERLEKQAEVLLDLAESGMSPEPKQLREFMLLSSEACDLLRSIASDQPEPQAENRSQLSDIAESLTGSLEQLREFIFLSSEATSGEVDRITTYEAFEKLYPELMEREGLEIEATELVCNKMDEKKLTYQQLAAKVGWSKKKLKRVLASGITVKQLARLLFACGCRAKIEAEELHEIAT